MIEAANGQRLDLWLCSVCRDVLDNRKKGQPRSDEQKRRLLTKKVDVRYTRPEPAPGITFTKAFWRMNARRREGIMNEHEWNAALMLTPDLEMTDPNTFAERKARYESTKGNGQNPRKRRQ